MLKYEANQMIVSKTPLRMSFAGGGSDISSFYLDEPGSVISTAIDKYVNVCINPKFDDRIRLSYSKTEDVEDISQIEHPIVKEILLFYKVNHGIEIASLADIPSKGTGLGSSSSFTVGLINALRFSLGETSTPNILAEQACNVEIERLNSPIGKQDQYAAAFGGLNFFQFMPDGSVVAEKVKCSSSLTNRIEKQIVVFYTGLTRSANDVLSMQKKAMENSSKKFLLRRMVEL
jgi:D-glycero-alpha-D-manno-heptose-7-phosphate kinase